MYYYDSNIHDSMVSGVLPTSVDVQKEVGMY